MKRKLFFNALVVILLPFVLSCSQGEKVYSCDSSVNDWAVSNINQIRRMNRAQFLELENGAYQRAAFRVFTAEQKLQLWQNKFEQLLTLTIWSEKEILHIKKLKAMLDENSHWYDDRTTKTKATIEEEEDAITVASFIWRDYAKEELGWNERLIYLVAGDPGDMTSREVIVTKAGGEMQPDDGSGRLPDCNCTEEWRACFPTDCSNSIECIVTDSGCGFVWTQPCTGRCEP